MLPIMKRRRHIGLSFVAVGLASLISGALVMRLAGGGPVGLLYDLLALALAVASVYFVGAGFVSLIRSIKP